MAEKIKFLRGTLANLPTTRDNNTLYFVEDSGNGALYLGSTLIGKDFGTYIGSIPTGYDATTIIGYINEKAQEVLDSASGGSSESAASVLAQLNTYKAENGAKVSANTTAIERLESDKADKATTLAGYGITNAYTKTETDNKVSTALSEAKDYADTIKADILGEGDLVATYDTLKEIGDWIVTSGIDATELSSAIAVETSAREANDKTLQDAIDAIEADIEANRANWAKDTDTIYDDSDVLAAIATIEKDIFDNRATWEKDTDTVYDDAAVRNLISTAQSTADTAKTNAATAQSTADTAKTNAATAQAKADSAYTLAGQKATLSEATSAAKSAIQGNTDATVADAINAINVLYNKTSTDLDTTKVVLQSMDQSVKGVESLLEWGSFSS